MSSIRKISQDHFQSLLRSNPRPFLVEFGADWCPPCKALLPVLEELSEEFSSQVDIFRVDVETEELLAVQFMIRSLPTVIAFKEGRAVEELFGKQPKANYVAAISKLIKTQQQDRL